ncbi:MAG TPA: hypothetical protein VKT77_03715 [Chthonomonadaceae bacterium]|nr:hypothetical protein [Chthonomonadaceae bacterium]
MNEPVRVGIAFPRSGQQISVQITRDFAAELNTVCAGLQSKGVVMLRLGDDRPTPVIEHSSRTQ